MTKRHISVAPCGAFFEFKKNLFPKSSNVTELQQ